MARMILLLRRNISDDDSTYSFQTEPILPSSAGKSLRPDSGVEVNRKNLTDEANSRCPKKFLDFSRLSRNHGGYVLLASQNFRTLFLPLWYRTKFLTNCYTTYINAPASIPDVTTRPLFRLLPISHSVKRLRTRQPAQIFGQHTDSVVLSTRGFNKGSQSLAFLTSSGSPARSAARITISSSFSLPFANAVNL